MRRFSLEKWNTFVPHRGKSSLFQLNEQSFEEMKHFPFIGESHVLGEARLAAVTQTGIPYPV